MCAIHWFTHTHSDFYPVLTMSNEGGMGSQWVSVNRSGWIHSLALQIVEFFTN